MRRIRFNTLVCSLLSLALLAATSQYLAHFHLQPLEAAAHAAPAHPDDATPHSQEHCSLCLQFDRLPAPPATQSAPPPHFFLIATLEAERLERRALDSQLLWPPSRGPPTLV